MSVTSNYYKEDRVEDLLPYITKLEAISDKEEKWFNVKSGTKTYSVVLRKNGTNICTCRYGTVHIADREKVCAHVLSCLEKIKRNM